MTTEKTCEFCGMPAPGCDVKHAIDCQNFGYYPRPVIQLDAIPEPSVEGLMDLVYHYGGTLQGPMEASLVALRAIRAYAERLHAFLPSAPLLKQSTVPVLGDGISPLECRLENKPGNCGCGQGQCKKGHIL